MQSGRTFSQNGVILNLTSAPPTKQMISQDKAQQKKGNVMSKSVIIFDLDGTLIDSALDLATAVNRMLTKLDLPVVAIDTVKSWVGNGSYNLVTRALTHHGAPSDDKSVHDAHEIFLAEYSQIADDTTAYAGVHDGLATLQANGFRLALCTNKPYRFLAGILGAMGWSDSFDVVLGGDSLPTKKPDPAPLQHICTTLGVTIDDAIMVGDSKNDIQAGKACGMTTLALRYGYNYGEPIDSSEPDAAFDDFGGLVSWIVATYR